MVIDVLRTICWFFDKIIYGLIAQIYNIFVMLTEATIFTQADIKAFSTRLYALISLVMVFKLAFSFISYIVNPDTLVDKQKGGSKLITNIVIAIALLASTPLIFNEAYYVQGVIVKEGVIEKLVLGTNSNYKTNKPEQLLSTYTFLTFFAPNPNLTACATSDATTISSDCITKLDEANSDIGAGTVYSKAVSSGELNELWGYNGDLINLKTTVTSKEAGTKSDYVFNYQFGISTVLGIMLCLILLNFCLDIAIRVIKLGFLQLIAPIPIILSISPGKKNDTLSKWGKECFQTYASLFLRTAVIYFALSIIGTINKGGGVISFVSGGTNTNPFVKIFLIFGVLLFAKEFPKLLEELLGMKFTSKFSLNPLKRMAEAPVFGGLTRKTAGLASAGASLLGNSAKAGGAWLAGKAFMKDKSRADEHFHQRMHAMGAEARGRYAAGGLAADKRYSGDTQWKAMHKSNLDEGKKISDQKFADKQHDKAVKKGDKALQQIAGDAKAKGILDKLAAGQEIEPDEEKILNDAYQKAYGKSHSETATREAQLAIAKSKDEYYKKSVAQLQRMADADPTNIQLATQLNAAQKAMTDNEKTISGLEDDIKGLAITDAGGAQITKGIKLAKGAKYKGNASIDAHTTESAIEATLNSSKQKSAVEQATLDQKRNDDMAAAIAAGITNGLSQSQTQNNPNNGQNNGPINGQNNGQSYIIGENGSPLIDLNGNPISSKNAFKGDTNSNTTAADYDGDSSESADKAIHESTKAAGNVDEEAFKRSANQRNIRPDDKNNE